MGAGRGCRRPMVGCDLGYGWCRWLLLRAGHPDHAAKRRDRGVRRAAAASGVGGGVGLEDSVRSSMG
ncbi:hypothetical protein Ae717Ps2_6568c [Pseudonocardia sp. Ae717_Ps2]|nr:hypothetical protein Ae717Ps2_6515c [Pseudonocardia sp. Ae717_Ps2]OLM28330.1 hypothetical protein Ae717Ps2_6532c [Pseudonocardia sp. Ae717_Ps2]OLM28348.1 hypothetical protein Ae717Ps2_6550c [Pseudonocardia sp. Ae717_Ps2]OLM28366.1 hypothetical protein Ae717Ps2_6568c [Pseudonocardia sp. Ae717_Ps2]